MKPLPKQLMPFFWHFLKPYRWSIFALFITGLLWGIQTSVTPYLLKLIIDNIAHFHGDKSHIWEATQWPVIGYIGLWFAMTFNFRFTDWINLKMFPEIRKNMINDMFAYLNQHSHRFLQNHFAGNLSNKVMDMAGSAFSLFQRTDEFVANICAFSIALISTFLVSPLFSFILFLWAISFIGVTLLFMKKTKILSADFSESRSRLSGRIVDSISNITNMRLFARHTFENQRLNETVMETVEKDIAVQWYILKMRIYWDLTFVLLIALMLVSLIILYSHNKLTLGDFTFIMTITINIFMHLWNMASQFVQFTEDLGKCSQALTIITAPHDIVDSPHAAPLRISKGTIVFDNVTFGHRPHDPLFKNTQVTIQGGSKVGLVGFSGSGKTTFVNLLLRFFDIDGGRILIDNQNIQQITQDSLHENISMIPQDTNLFHRSLMENIRYGKINASDDEVLMASQQSHCHDFIKTLPEQYETLVGERGIKLSGGQRQRIAIARAILKNAPILVLDEATSALDSTTEQYIHESLTTLMRNRTTIVIAHRLSTLSEMDRIIVFDQGKIIEDGSHETLIQLHGHYAKMWAMQAGGFLPK